MRTLKLLITGASSFSGQHALKVYSNTGLFELYGTSRRDLPDPRWAGYHVGDITNGTFVAQVLTEVKPTYILHLAGSNDPSNPEELIRVNQIGTWNLLESCANFAPDSTILLIGSAASFGEMPPPIRKLGPEHAPIPNSLYGLTREHALELGKVVSMQYGLKVKKCRTFNLIGPGLPEKYAAASIAKRMTSRTPGDTTPFAVSNANFQRDFLDVRDACRAWLSILQYGSTETVYSVGSGVAVSVFDLAITLRKLLGRTFPIEEVSHTSLRSRTTIERSVADINRLTEDTDWLPNISLEQSLKEMLDYSHKPTIT